MIKKVAITILIFTIIIHPVKCFGSAFLERQLTLLVQHLSKNFKDRMVGEGDYPASIAVMDFDSPSSDLRARRIGSGVSELISTYLVKLDSKTFKVFERKQLIKILTEQSLQLTGILTRENSIKIGKLSGVKFLLIGSVTSVGDSYSLQARIVNSETAEVIASQNLSIPSEDFEKKAKQYIIPKKESIGVYLGYRSFNIKSIAEGKTITIEREDGGTVTISNVEYEGKPIQFIVAGNRFYIIDRVMCDVSMGSMATTEEKYVFDCTQDLSNFYHTETNAARHPPISNLFFAVHWVQPVTPRMDIFAGAGLCIFYIQTISVVPSNIPVMRMGAEIRPKQNFGFSVFGSYLLETDEVFDISRRADEIPKVPLYKWDRISIEITGSFYF